MFCGLGNILLGSENITNRVNKVMIVDTTGEATTAQLFLKVGEKLNVEGFQTVHIEDADGGLLFGGRVEGYPASIETMAGSAQKIICRDWSVECGYRQVIEHFSDWKISDIYISLVQKYLPEHTTDNVTETEEKATLRFNGDSVKQCLNALSDLMGWTWQVSADRDHYFGETFIEKVTEEITDEVVDTKQGRTTNFEKDYSTLANRVWVEGGEGSARNFSEQFVSCGELQTTVEPILRENYPHQIPVWYKTGSVEVFAVYDRGDGVLEHGRQVRLDCGANENIAGQKVYMPTSELDFQQKRKNPLSNISNFSLMSGKTNRTTHHIVAEYDALFVSDADENSDGGYVYLRDSVANPMKIEARYYENGFIGERLKRSIDPNTTPATENKLLGFKLRYRRKLKISYVTDVDEESVALYGVQIDLPKVSRPAIKDWNILYKYAQFLLTKHRDPPRKGRVTVYRYKNGWQVYEHNLKSGQLVDINLSRFGTLSNVKLTKITHEISPDCWRILADSTLDPYLYSTMMADIMRRIHQLELEDATGDVINSMTTLNNQFVSVSSVPQIKSFSPDEDYGFDESLWGASEWEG